MECEVHWIGCQLSEIASKVGQPSAWEIVGIVVTAIAAVATLLISAANLVLLLAQHKLRKQADERDAYIRRKTFTGVLGQFCLVAVSSSFFGKDEETRSERKSRSMDAYAAIGATGEKTAGKLFSHLMTAAQCIQAGDSRAHLVVLNGYISASLKSWEDDPKAELLPMPEIFESRYRQALSQSSWP